MLSTRRVSVFLLIPLLASCGPRDDPHDRVIHYQGKPESDLRREVGPPTRDEPVAADDEYGPCHETDAKRALTYDIPSRGAEKRVLDAFGMGPAEQLVACVDSTGHIVGVDMVIIN